MTRVETIEIILIVLMGTEYGNFYKIKVVKIDLINLSKIAY